VPTHAEDYIHRIGRTGRAGRSGTSLTLAAPSDGKYLDAIVKLIQRDIPLLQADAEAPAEAATPAVEDAPRRERSRGRTRRETQAPPAETVEAKPSRGRSERRPRQNEGRGNKTERLPDYASDTPFGSDGPVPAFLLRPGSPR
jgi:superfamily II DNA/RNA helicase